MRILTSRSKSILGSIALGVLVSLASGLIEKRPEVGIPEIKSYGYPLVWRVTKILQPTEFLVSNLLVDFAFWITLFLLVFIILTTLLKKFGITVNYRKAFLPILLFIPLGLVMDFFHEIGHAIWGAAVGGKLTYMQITYFEIFPRIAITPYFVLGLTRIDGLIYGSFEYGFLLLGGSITTNIASWLLALILLKINLGKRTQVALRVLGLFGVLDLPFYVVFPQMGLGHWIFFGGGLGPEPLIGARMIGVPDLLFYCLVITSTLGLVFLYIKPFRDLVLRNRVRLLAYKRELSTDVNH